MKKSKIGKIVLTGIMSATLLVACTDSDNNENIDSSGNSVSTDNKDTKETVSTNSDKDEIISVVNDYYEMHRNPMSIPNNFNPETGEITTEFRDDNGKIIDASNPDEILEYIKSTSDFTIEDYFDTSTMTDDEKNELYGGIIGIRMFMPISGSIDEDNIEIKDNVAYGVLSEEMVLPDDFLEESELPVVESREKIVRPIKLVKTDNGWKMDHKSYLYPELLEEGSIQ